MIGEKQKWGGRGELLPLKQQRRRWSQQRQRANGAVSPRRRHLMKPSSERGIGHLVVVLDIGDKRLRGEIECSRTPPLLLPGVPLPLIQVAILRTGNELLYRTGV